MVKLYVGVSTASVTGDVYIEAYTLLAHSKEEAEGWALNHIRTKYPAGTYTLKLEPMDNEVVRDWARQVGTP